MATVKRGTPSSRTFASVDISTAASGLSELVDITGLTLSCISMPAAWTHASLTLFISIDGTTNVVPAYDTAGNVIAYQTSASRALVFDPAQFQAVQKFQFGSVTTNASSAIAQAATRTIKLGLA